MESQPFVCVLIQMLRVLIGQNMFVSSFCLLFLSIVVRSMGIFLSECFLPNSVWTVGRTWSIIFAENKLFLRII